MADDIEKLVERLQATATRWRNDELTPEQAGVVLDEAASTITSLQAELADAKLGLGMADCPYPAKGRPEDETVTTCVAADCCGCALGWPLMPPEQRERIQAKRPTP